MPVVNRTKKTKKTPSWEPELDEIGFVADSKLWVPVEHYPLLEREKVRGANIYRTKNDETIPLQYSIVCSLKQGTLYQWPAVVAITNERRIRFDLGSKIRFGIRGNPNSNLVTEWMIENDFPLFKDAHVHISNPDYVLMGGAWNVINKRGAR